VFEIDVVSIMDRPRESPVAVGFKIPVTSRNPKKPPEFGSFFVNEKCYSAVRYVLSPRSFFADSTLSPGFLVIIPLINPRILWFCQAAASAIRRSWRLFPAQEFENALLLGVVRLA
jgi:hypothetical protein